MKITSKDNSKIKDAVSLRSERSVRREKGQIFLEGVRLCGDAYKRGVVICTLFATEKGLARLEEEYPGMRVSALECFEVSDVVAEKLSDTKTNQGVFCVCEMPKGAVLRDIPFEKGVILLSSLQDPGNVGTIIRTSEALGIGGIILSEDCPDIYSPKVLRGTMGGVFRLPIMVSASLTDSIAELRGMQVKVYGAALEKDSSSVKELSLKGCGVVIGNEGKGLSSELKEACDGLVIIPIEPESESLNAAVAASLLAWEMVR